MDGMEGDTRDFVIQKPWPDDGEEIASWETGKLSIAIMT